MANDQSRTAPGAPMNCFPTGEVWERAKAECNWLVYRLVPREGKKPQKIPQTVDGVNAGAKAAASLTFEEACDAAKALGREFGVGYLPRTGSAMVCVDFDGVLEDGTVIQPELPEFKSYAEVSPSGTGLHVLIARPDNLAPTTFDDGNDWAGFLGSDSKFFTVTLKTWGGTTCVCEDKELVSMVFARREASAVGAKEDQTERRQQDSALKQLQRRDQQQHWFYRLPIDLRAKCAEEMLAALPPKFAKGYDTWLQAGMALKPADENYQLFRVWDNWSQTAPNYDGRTEEKWETFSTSLDDEKPMVSIRTVISWAKDHNWDPSKWEHVATAVLGKKIAVGLQKTPDKKTRSAPSNLNGDPSGGVSYQPSPWRDLTRPGGLVEVLADYGEIKSSRETRLPAFAGALAAVSALTQRYYITKTPGFLTSPGLQIVLVAESGVGKEAARAVLYDVCELQRGIGFHESYASAPAMHAALASKPTQLWANDEFGRFLKAAANPDSGGHDYGLVTMAMKLHTMTDKFLPERIYSKSAPLPRVNHPLLVGMHVTTPKALFDAMDVNTVVDGMLGRLLVIQIKDSPPLKPLRALSSEGLPEKVRALIRDLDNKLTQEKFRGVSIDTTDDTGIRAQMVPGIEGHRFFPITPTDEAIPHFEEIRTEMEDRAVNGAVAALWRRAYEQVLRVAGVVAFGHAVMNGNLAEPKITKDILLWARDFVRHCLEELEPLAEEHASDGERDKLQKAILNNLKKLGAESGPGRWVNKTDLLQNVKGRGRSYSALKDEIFALNDCGDIEFKIGDDGVPSAPSQLRTRG